MGRPGAMQGTSESSRGSGFGSPRMEDCSAGGSDYEDPERTAGPDDSAESGFEGDDDVDGASIPAAHCNSAARQDSIVRN
jgi:hypothetical protein